MAACIQAMDVIGVDNGDNGQSCRQHPVCGNFVIPGDKLYCKWAIQNFDAGINEACVQVHRVAKDGVVKCHVGFLSHCLFARNRDHGRLFESTWLRV